MRPPPLRSPCAKCHHLHRCSHACSCYEHHATCVMTDRMSKTVTHPSRSSPCESSHSKGLHLSPWRKREEGCQTGRQVASLKGHAMRFISRKEERVETLTEQGRGHAAPRGHTAKVAPCPSRVVSALIIYLSSSQISLISYLSHSQLGTNEA